MTNQQSAEELHKLFISRNLGWEGGGGYFAKMACWFSFNNSEAVKAVTLAFCSI